MPTSTNVTNLKINELTEAQYDAAVQGGVIGANELSVLTDAQIDPLPSQTGNAGKFLTTDGTDASWSDKPLVNTNPTNTTGLIIGNNGGNLSVVRNNSISIVATGNYGGWIALGTSAIAIGTKNAEGDYSINIGGSATPAKYAIQLGAGDNSTANTFNVGLSSSNNYRLLDSDGTIPEARLADMTSATTGQVLTLDSNNNAIWKAVTVTTTATLVAADWSSNAQTITVQGVTTTNVVFVSPDPASLSDYASAGITCVSQGTDSLTFNCVNVPSNAITVSIVML